MQQCPVCSAEVKDNPRYLRQLCPPCSNKAESADGRPLRFSNVDLSGGFIARYVDTGQEHPGHECFVGGMRCHADEARFGGIVIEAVDPQPPSSTQAERWKDPVGLPVPGAKPLVPPLAGRFWIVGDRPVRVIAMPDGGMSVEALDWNTGDLVRNLDYLSRVCFPDGDTDEVTAEEFDTRVKALQKTITDRR